MNRPSTYQAYYKTNVQTSDQLNLIIMLYDGLIRFLKKAEVKIENREYEESHNYLTRSKNIVQELLSTLKMDQGGDIAKNLQELYLYCFRRIVEANLKKDPQMVEEVIRIVDNLRQGWIQVRAQRKQTTELTQQRDKKLRVQG
ncbi:MAG: flagellar export chaperone FliS [SAR324 cluster bacterium]|nr:flagellar export chaperone FliS [SAR324 cluster bacterium]